MKNKVLMFFASAPPSLREMLSRMLQSENYEARWTDDEQEAISLAQRQRFDLLLLDFNRPLKRALNALEQLRSVNPFAPVILIIERNTECERAVAGRFAALIRKPFAVSLLLEIMREVLTPLPEAAKSDALEQHAHIPSQ